MYIQRIPHSLVHFNREFDSATTLVIVQTASTNGTASSSLSKAPSHRLGYVVLAISLAIALLCIAGFFVARRRVCSFLPCTARRTRRRDLKRESALQPQQEDHTRCTNEFNSLNARNGSESSRTPTSPSSEGPSTPVDGEECGNPPIKGAPNAKDECSFVPIPIIVHSPRQTHQTTFLTGPDASSQEFGVPLADQQDFFEEILPMVSHGSAIRPHGLPLSPVPEESSGMVSCSSPHMEMDETPYVMTSDEYSAH